MKLRYQMRGLGIGIFVTALLMGVATKEGRPLTDAEIRAKAYELGMVDGDSVRLTDIKGSTPNPQGTLPPQETAMPQDTSAPGETAVPGTAQPPAETVMPQDTAAPGETAVPGTAQPPQGTAEPAPEGDGSEEAVTVVIMRGAYSYDICVQLAEAGLIENAREFDSYLCKNGYAEKVRAGTYRITPGTSEEQIVRIITGIR